MYSSAAKSCAYVAKATPWFSLLLYSTWCVHVCVCVRVGTLVREGWKGGKGGRRGNNGITGTV